VESGVKAAVCEGGQLELRELVTHRVPLARLAEAVRLMLERRAVEVYVTPMGAGAPAGR
jgi:Zn-dependent alcohol dehydrogenase